MVRVGFLLFAHLEAQLCRELLLGRSSDNLCVSRDIEARLPYGFEMVCQMANHFLVKGHSG